MKKTFIHRSFTFNIESFPNIFYKQSKIIINYIYNTLLEREPNIKYIKIKIYFFDNEGLIIKEMFFFKERPNKITSRDFHYNFIVALSKWLKNNDLKNISEYEIIASYTS